MFTEGPYGIDKSAPAGDHRNRPARGVASGVKTPEPADMDGDGRYLHRELSGAYSAFCTETAARRPANLITLRDGHSGGFMTVTRKS